MWPHNNRRIGTRLCSVINNCIFQVKKLRYVILSSFDAMPPRTIAEKLLNHQILSTCPIIGSYISGFKRNWTLQTKHEPYNKIWYEGLVHQKDVRGEQPPRGWLSAGCGYTKCANNSLPSRVPENRNLYTFFGKGGSIRAPSKKVYLAKSYVLHKVEMLTL